MIVAKDMLFDVDINDSLLSLKVQDIVFLAKTGFVIDLVDVKKEDQVNIL